MDEKLKAIIEEGLKNSGFSKFWFMVGGSINYTRKIKDLREMCSSFPKAAWNQAFEAGVKFALESKELEEWKKGKQTMIESSIVLYDGEVLAIDVGGPASVEFNFEKIWEFFRRKKELGSWSPTSLRFYHVHPEGFLNYSMTDLNCVKGFNLAFGSCFNFNIITFNNPSLKDLSHNRICFDYAPKFGKNMSLNEDDYWNKLSNEHAFILKALSYGHVTSTQE